MARALDQIPFYPEMAAPPSANVGILRDALGIIYKELEYQLTALGPENFSEKGLARLIDAMGLAPLLALACHANDGKVVVIQHGKFAAVDAWTLFPETEIEATSEFAFTSWLETVSFDASVDATASNALAEVLASLDMSDIGYTFEGDAESTASSAASAAIAELEMSALGFTFESSAEAA